MKKKLLNIYEKTQKLTFFQGVAITVCFTSIISIASTVLPNGLFSFSANTPISASEINANFEKVAGKVILNVKYNPLSLTNGSYGITTGCTDTNTCHYYNKKVYFQNKIISDPNSLKETSISNPDTTPASQTFNYFEVPTTGWYEVRFTPSTPNFSLTDASCAVQDNSCSFSFQMNANLFLVENLAAIDGMYMTNVGSKNFSINRSNYDGNPNELDAPSAMGGGVSLLESKRVFLTAGQIIFATFTSNYNAYNLSNDSLSASFGGLELTILKL